MEALPAVSAPLTVPPAVVGVAVLALVQAAVLTLIWTAVWIAVLAALPAAVCPTSPSDEVAYLDWSSSSLSGLSLGLLSGLLLSLGESSPL